jgi:hypothetical protein
MSSSPNLGTETDTVSETSCLLECRTMNKVKKKVILCVIHHPENRLEHFVIVQEILLHLALQYLMLLSTF